MIKVKTSQYQFPEVQETSFIEWNDVVKQITSNKQSKQQIEKSNQCYESFMVNNNFLDDTLELKRNIIQSAIKQYIDIDNERFQIRVPEAENVILYNKNQKISEQSIPADTLSEADLQDKASRAAERACAEMIQEFYSKPVVMDPNSNNISTCQLIEWKYEPCGPKTAPDLFLKFLLTTNDNEQFELNTLLEVKSVLSSIKPDKTLEINYNNASNSKGLVINDLDTFKDKNVFMNRDNNTGENSNRTKIYSTLACFIYYYPDNKNHNLVFFDTDILWFPMTLEFDISPKTGEITDKIFKVKSAGEHSVNNNVNLSLSTPYGIYEKQDILFNRLMLYLTGYTVQDYNIIKNNEPYDLYHTAQNHLLTKFEVMVESMRIKSLILQTIIEQQENLNKLNIKTTYDIFKDSYKYIQKSLQNNEYKLFESEIKNDINSRYELAKQFIKELNRLYKHTNECIDIENDINELMDIQDSMTYNDFKYACDHIKKRWNNVKKIDERFCDNKQQIQDQINEFKVKLKVKKKNS